jgi:PPOX class probable F420-dependent enzyme
MSSASVTRLTYMVALSDDIRGLFAGANTAHIATILPDGSPHSVPLWVGLRGDRIAFLTSRSSRKGRNINRDPRVAISITRADQAYTAGSIRGRVVEVIDSDEGWEIIDEIARKYTGQPYPLREDRVAFLVEPEHVWAQGFG